MDVDVIKGAPEMFKYCIEFNEESCFKFRLRKLRTFLTETVLISRPLPQIIPIAASTILSSESEAKILQSSIVIVCRSADSLSKLLSLYKNSNFLSFEESAVGMVTNKCPWLNSTSLLATISGVSKTIKSAHSLRSNGKVFISISLITVFSMVVDFCGGYEANSDLANKVAQNGRLQDSQFPLRSFHIR